MHGAHSPERSSRLASGTKRHSETLVASAPLAYREYANETESLSDRALFAQLSDSTPTAVTIGRPRPEHGQGNLLIKRYARGTPLALQQALAVLDRFGLCLADYRAFEFQSAGRQRRQLQVFVIDSPDANCLDNPALTASLSEALDHAWQANAEVDGFSRLILLAAIRSREADILRAYARFMRQIGHGLDQEYLATALAHNPEATRALVTLFHARFDPARGDESPSITDATESVMLAIAACANNEDTRLLHLFHNLIGATLRTNAYQQGAHGLPKPVLAFKFDSRAIDGSPAPQPLYEIFVYSQRFEGIHLRGGKVARGGIRWSDRLRDYRTEVHGLFKAQMVKNVVIVPEGAKGGFVLKQPPLTGPQALREEAIQCYRAFICALLDITDNLVDGRVVPPHGVIRHDGDDPYLVVAADKGTATFSDLANGAANEYGFWLGDAFASGGSAGYDHKALGITARGAWEAVKRHFRELGIDAQHTPITVAGVGDMSGDVFGNGLLLSHHMRLVGAFDHRHIFVDPQPHPEHGATERQRLFALPASSWADFDPAAMGPGGAIYRRDAASIELSAEAQERFGLPAVCSPEELMRAILRAEVDLLWLGGIGTYVRATDETDASVGDRANDALRITGNELRCKVVGEGANLGVTQLGRVEYALAGGRINTDAIDNAGGVSCSDHEVNIKILLAGIESTHALSRAARDELLREMSDEVCGLVLHDIIQQTQSLSLATLGAPRHLARHARLLHFFEHNGQLDRRVAGLPDREELNHRKSSGIGLCRPELAVLLAHTKVALFAEFIASSLPDDPLLQDDLLAYFPKALRSRYPDAIRNHPLRREIITTAVVNSMVNRIGSGLVNDIHERTGASDADIARAYLIARRLFDMETLWTEIEKLDTADNSQQHRELLFGSRDIIENAVVWLLRRLPGPLEISHTVARFQKSLAELITVLPQFVVPDPAASPVAQRLQCYRQASAHLDILLLAERRSCGIVCATRMLFGVSEAILLPDLLRAARRIASRSEIDSLAAGELALAASGAAAEIARHCLDVSGCREAAIRDFLSPHRPLLARYSAWRNQTAHTPVTELAPVYLAVEALRAIAGSST